MLHVPHFGIISGDAGIVVIIARSILGLLCGVWGIFIITLGMIANKEEHMCKQNANIWKLKYSKQMI